MRYTNHQGVTRICLETPADRGFSGRSRPERFSTMESLAEYYRSNTNAWLIARTAKDAGIQLTNMGKSTEEICIGMERAASKLGDQYKGYKSPVHALASLLLAKNDRDTAIALIDGLAARTEGEGKTHLTNISNMMKTAKRLDLDIRTLGKNRAEAIADEALRVATHPKYISPENGVAIVALMQRAPEAAGIILERIVPERSISELDYLRGFIKEQTNRKRIEAAEAEPILSAIRARFEALLPRKL